MSLEEIIIATKNRGKIDEFSDQVGVDHGYKFVERQIKIINAA